MSTTVDIATTANVLLSLAAAAVTAAIPILVPAMLKRWGSANTADMTNNLENVLTAAAGGAYKYAASHVGGLSNVAVNNGALADATNYVLTSLPNDLKTLGITPEKVTQMVNKRLGTLLATDPSVSAGTPPPATPTGVVAVAPIVVAPQAEEPPLEPVVIAAAPAVEVAPPKK